LPKDNNLAFHDIKQDPITIAQLEEMHQMAGSYEAFSKKSTALQIDGLKDKT
jgi:arsenate reductase